MLVVAFRRFVTVYRSPIFKSQAAQLSDLEDGTDRLFRNLATQRLAYAA
jgi:hypothetical protein